jgi:hypothetical protein
VALCANPEGEPEMWIIAVIVLVLAALAVYELRLRKPDQFVLYEADGEIRLRRRAFYPRHFSLAMPAATQQLEVNLEGTSRGNIPLRASLVVTVAPARDHLTSLVRAGGWQQDAVARAAQAFQAAIQGSVKEFTERRAVEEISSEALGAHLEQRLAVEAPKFGLEIVSLSVQAIEPADPAIAEALRQRESARILEQTELLKHQARVSAARARIEADEQIALSEHELARRKFELQRIELEQEAALAEKRTEEELKRNRMRLAFEKEEMALLKTSPELLLLTPQAARLAEASQSLKNARTIVSIGASDAELGYRLSRIFQRFLDLVDTDKRELGEQAGRQNP